MYYSYCKNKNHAYKSLMSLLIKQKSFELGLILFIVPTFWAKYI